MRKLVEATIPVLVCASLVLISVAAVLAADPPAPQATSVDRIKAAPGFKVELLYSVPRNQGSWVNLCFDGKGRIITSDQGGGGLYRLTLNPEDPSKLGVEKLEANLVLGTHKDKDGKETFQTASIGGAQGLLWAFDSLYVMSCAGGAPKGLYRLRDTDGDDKFDKVEKLREIPGQGEHGPHGIALGPDGKSIYLVAGNRTAIPKPETSRVPRRWDEDQLLPRIGDGHDPTLMAPGGWVARTDPEGKSFELICSGMRNTYDISFNADGELFAYDSDMEWDMGLPWYRPTRLTHIVSGGEFGWRNGSGKWPAWYPDSLPPTIDIGPGSPTGSTFGYGAKFPAKYQQAMYVNDWSYGNIYAVHLKPSGATYTAELEKFISGVPLPVTDTVIGPDGAMYFIIGGRGTQSGLYRVTYTGTESAAPFTPTVDVYAREARGVRHALEAFHGREDAKAVDTAWPHLGSPDRFIRFAARIAIEHQPVAQWQERALAEKHPQSSITIMLALARCGDKALEPKCIEALNRIDIAKLAELQQLELLRAYGLVFERMGKPEGEVAASVIAKLDGALPSESSKVNRELSAVLVYLGASGAVGKTVELLGKATDPKEQVWYAYVLRAADGPWTMDQRKAFFAWQQRAAEMKGGVSFRGFMGKFKDQATAKLGEAEKKELGDLLTPKPKAVAVKEKPFVKAWTVAELGPLVEKGMQGRDYARGRALYGEALCASCHTIAGEGGIGGPDLTGLANRFAVKDILESIIEPSKVISDQYEATIFTMKDGSQVVGKIVNANQNSRSVCTSLLAPAALTGVNINDVVKQEPSKVSMMPQGLIYNLSESEVLDLMAYLMSGGDKNHAAFKK